MKRYSWLLGGLAVCACSGNAIDVGPGSAAGAPGSSGSDSGGSSGSSNGNGGASGRVSSVPAELACGDNSPLPTWPSTDACATGSDLPLVGTWHGYIETQTAPWDELTLVIRGASVSGGVSCGTLTVGHGAIPAPATDPNLNYPDGAQGGGPAFDVTAGFPLTLLNGNTDGTRLRFSISKGEVMRSWCALQDSYGDGFGACVCLPNWGFKVEGSAGQCKLTDPAGKHDLSVGASRCFLCVDRICACNSEGCDVAPDGSNDFDLRFSAGTAEGADSEHSGFRTYFTRVP